MCAPVRNFNKQIQTIPRQMWTTSRSTPADIATQVSFRKMLLKCSVLVFIGFARLLSFKLISKWMQYSEEKPPYSFLVSPKTVMASFTNNFSLLLSGLRPWEMIREIMNKKILARTDRLMLTNKSFICKLQSNK